MASSPEFRGTTTPNSGGASVSYFQKTVSSLSNFPSTTFTDLILIVCLIDRNKQLKVRLLDWWLIRAENDSIGKTLAVAGLTSTP